MHQVGFFDLPDHLQQLSDAGDPLEAFRAFRERLTKANAIKVLFDEVDNQLRASIN